MRLSRAAGVDETEKRQGPTVGGDAVVQWLATMIAASVHRAFLPPQTWLPEYRRAADTREHCQQKTAECSAGALNSKKIPPALGIIAILITLTLVELNTMMPNHKISQRFAVLGKVN